MPADRWNELTDSLYVELRRLAGGLVRQERTGHTLQATALVHEALLRLGNQVDAGDRPRLLGVASTLMRQVLIDHARRRKRLKRGGNRARISLSASAIAENDAPLDLIDLDEALKRLEVLSPRQASIVTMRFFGGLTMPEVADAAGVSLRTAEQDWQFARAWLRRALSSSQ